MNDAKFRDPSALAAVLTAPTPHCFCLGLYVAEPLALALYTTETLRLAEREAETMLSPDAAARLRDEISLRKNPLLWKRPSGRDYQADEELIFEPVLVSTRDLVETTFSPEVQPLLRRGLCLRVEVALVKGDPFEEPFVQGSDGLRRSIAAAWSLLRSEARLPREGRIRIRLPEVVAWCPLDGGSAGIAFYRAFLTLAGEAVPASTAALTGALDPGTGRILSVAGIPEKSAAAAEAGLGGLFYPANPSAVGAGFPRPGRGAATAPLHSIPASDPHTFLAEVRKRTAPWRDRITLALKIATLAGMISVMETFRPLYDLCVRAADGVNPWVASWAATDWPADIARRAVGFPLKLALVFAPWMLFFLVYWMAHDLIEKLVRVEPAAAPVCPDPPVTLRRRIARILFHGFALGAAWTWAVVIFTSLESLRDPLSRLTSGIESPAAKLTLALALLGLFVAVLCLGIERIARLRDLLRARYATLR